jgi:hypothetical protein
VCWSTGCDGPMQAADRDLKLLGVGIAGIAVVVVVAVMAALHAHAWMWIVALVIAGLLLVWAVRLWFKPSDPPKELPLGVFEVSTKDVDMSLPSAEEGYMHGASVWPSRWWRPSRPTIIHWGKERQDDN